MGRTKKIKIAVAIADSNAAPSAFVVWRGFEESIPKAAALGYDGVELALKTADDVKPAKLARTLEKHSLEVSCISTGQVFAALGLYFTHTERKKRKEAVNVFKGLVSLAKDFGQLVNVGRARGFIAEGQKREDAEALLIESCRELCDFAGENKVSIVIEPVNRYEINFINNIEEGAELVEKVGRKNLGLMPDVFHMNIEDAGIGRTLAKFADHVRYVHLADSNRLAPGWGHLDFGDIFSALRKIKYRGWCSVEILPKPDPDSAAKKAIETVRKTIA